jgi:hypothetical protein
MHLECLLEKSCTSVTYDLWLEEFFHSLRRMIQLDQGVWCAEAPGIQGLESVGGGLSTQNAIGAV